MTPRTKVEFTTTLPITSPNANSLCPLDAELSSNTNSGRLVPIATINKPTIIKGITKSIAIAFAYWTTYFELKNKRTKLKININVFKITSYLLILFSIFLVYFFLDLIKLYAYKENTPIKIAPSILDNLFPIKNNAIGAIQTKNILTTSFFTANGFICMFLEYTITIPKIKVRSTIFEPITFPNDKFGVLAIADEIPTNNSGKEVANAIIINPIMNSPNLKKAAIFDNDFTRNDPLRINTMHAIAKYNIFNAKIPIHLFI